MRPIVKTIAITFLLTAGLFLFSCAQEEDFSHIKVMEMSLPDLSGQAVDLNRFKGQVIMLNFWASWCGPCREEIPDFVELQGMFGSKGLTIVGVSVDEDKPEIIQEFSQSFNINYPILYAGKQTKELKRDIPFRAIPTTLLVNRQGKVVRKITGLIAPEAWERYIRELL